MSDPLSENVPGYNTSPRPRPRKRFRAFSAPESLEGYYSPFWPLLVVFFAFIILLIYEISFLRFRTVTLRTQILRLSDGVQKAKTQLEFIQNLHNDLTTLAPHNENAATILKEFFPPTPQTPVEPTDETKTPEK